ncbi:protein maintenance of PSII under high light 1 [Tanacetum coccineum]
MEGDIKGLSLKRLEQPQQQQQALQVFDRICNVERFDEDEALAVHYSIDNRMKDPFPKLESKRDQKKEPAVYVAESALSSGTSGTSADGSKNTTTLFALGALIFVASASTILLQVWKNSPQIQTLDYSGPSLSYYNTKFKPSEIIQILVQTETAPSVQTESYTPQLDSAAQEIDICIAGELYPANRYKSFRNQDLCANEELYPESRLKSSRNHNINFY